MNAHDAAICGDAAPTVSTGAKLDLALKALAAVGAAGFIAGLLIASDRIWPAYLIAEIYLVHLGLAALFFVAVQYASKTGWSVVLRRIPEAMATSLVWAAILMPMILFGARTLYAWTREESFTHAAIAAKRAFLNLPFFSVRAILCFAAWLVPGALIIRNSRAQDADRLVARTDRNVKLSCLFLVLFAITVSLSSFDWLMSLEPEWYSTIFGAYVFAGLFTSGTAAMTILTVLLRRKGMFRKRIFCRFDGVSGIAPDESLVSPAHLHDLGKLLFAFSSFWAYLWFCQFMLIWYTNMPEESAWFARRMQNGWQILFYMNLVLNWIIPFFGLMSRNFKRNEFILLLTAGSVLLGHWLDLHLMILPVFHDSPVIGLWELIPTLGAAALFLLATFSALRTVPLIPTGDPMVEESVHHR